MSGSSLLQISALQLAQRVRSGDLSPVELVDAHIRRIEEVNPDINAVVAERFTAARAEARGAECALRRGARGQPLLGVPFTVKEMIEAAGMPLTFGCGNRRGRIARCDATVVARLRGVGAILLGVTNVPEWGMWPESYNSLYGRTNNPYDLRRTPGGSSGGEGAIVGAGGSAFGIGSDIGGSVRMPAAFCGVYAHKPTAGMLPLTGHHPVYAGGVDADLPRTAPYVTIGPLARSAGDLPLLLRVMAGPDGVDPNLREVTLRAVERVSWRGRRVVLLPSPRIRLARRTHASLRQCVLAAGAVLAGEGALVSEAPPDLLLRAGAVWSAALQSVGGRSFAELLGAGEPASLSRELRAVLLRRPRYSWPALFFLMAERFGRRGERAVRRAVEERGRIAARFRALLGDGGVLIMPVHPRVAPRHNAPVLHPFDFLYTAGLNALRVPATVVPAGFDVAGLPLAIQVTALEGDDHLTLAAAAVLESGMAPWRPAPVVPHGGHSPALPG
jgi:fatty acid amide hydrolase 2